MGKRVIATNAAPDGLVDLVDELRPTVFPIVLGAGLTYLTYRPVRDA